MTRATLIGVALLLLFSSCGGAGDDIRRPVEAVAIADDAFGVNGHVLRALSAGGEEELVGRHLNEIAAGGLEFVRANVDWVKFEPRPPVGGVHAFEVAGTDVWVGALAERGLRWQAIGIGASTPFWAVAPAAEAAGCGGRAPPAEPVLLAEMLAGVAERYGRGGSFWEENPELTPLPVHDYEIWNEPNHGAFWCPAPDPERFAEFVVKAAAAVRSVDPRARIVLGGLAPFRETVAAGPGVAAKMDATAFVAAMAAARPESVRAVDSIGIHSYGTPEAIKSDLGWYREGFDRIGLADVPVDINEVGWPTAGDETVPVPEPDRVEYMRDVVSAAVGSNCGVAKVAPHTWLTEEADPRDPEQWFGVADPVSAEPYASGAVYLELAGELAGREIGRGSVEALC